MPDWANEAASYSHRSERRKTEHGDSSSDEDSDGDVSDFESSQPLARLLRSANGLVGVQPGKSKKRKLRPEVINIQKMKHICNKGPVSTRQLLAGDSNTHSVCHYISPSPSNPPTYPRIRTKRQNGFVPFPQPITRILRTPHVSRHQTHGSNNHRFPPKRIRSPHIPLRKKAVLSRLERCNWPCRENQQDLWSERRTTLDGTLQALARWYARGVSRFDEKGGWCCQYSVYDHAAMGSPGSYRKQRRNCRV